MDDMSLDEAGRWLDAMLRAGEQDVATVNPFASPAWLRPFLQHIGEPSWRLLGVPAVAPGRTPWLLCGDQHLRTVRAVGNYYTSLVGPLDDEPDQAESAAALVRHVTGQTGGPVSLSQVLELEPLSAPMGQALMLAFQAEGWNVRLQPCFGNWHLPCAGRGFDHYMAQRPGRLQSTWRRKSRRFGAPDAGPWIEIVTDPARVEPAMDAYEQVYRRSWKVAEPYPAFIRAWALVCAERGWLRLGLAWLDGEAIAAQLWFTVAGKAYIFKLAYDERHAALSPGTVLSGHLFRHALEVDRVHEIDYLSGDDFYKTDWMTHRRQRVKLIACNLRTPFGAARAAVEGMRRLRRVVKFWANPTNALAAS
jgi:hypothetical protein